MGLSSKQVPNDHPLDWSQTLVELPKTPATKRQQQNQQQQSEPLKCPRCGSTNTKFCYYNNYNKSQPRHFCKACKRHWTKGGTLRNVPVGGGRKNKRLKTANAATSTAIATAISPIGGGISGRKYDNLAHSHQDCHITPLPALTNQKKDVSNSILYQALISSSSSVQHDPINAFNSKITLVNNASPMVSLPKDHQSLQFSFSSLSPFDTNIPCSFPGSVLSHNNNNNNNNAYELDHLESSTITTTTPTATSLDIFPDSWQGQTTNTSSIMAETPDYLNWNDIDPLVSAYLNLSWDDV